MKQFYWASLSAPLLFAATPASAAADCQPQFQTASQTVVISGISVSTGAVTSENFGIRIGNDGSGGRCPATLRIVRSNTSPVINPVDYVVQSGGQTLQVLQNESQPGTSASDLAIANLPSGNNGANFPFRISVASGWGMASGSQTDDLLVLLLDQTGAVVDTMMLTITFDVPPAVEVRVVGVTGQNAIASIDLGELNPRETTVSAPFGVRIWSTSPYTVSFLSQNQGSLVHGNLTSKISYRLFMDGQQINVRGAPAAYVPQPTNALGDLHPLNVRVEPFVARAGEYSDRVEVTVTAN